MAGRPKWLDKDYHKNKELLQRKKERLAQKLRRQQDSMANVRAVGQFFKIKALSDKQKFAIHLMTDFTYNYTMKQIAKKIGTPYDTVLNWRRDPFFLQCLDNEITKLRTLPRLEAYRHLFRWVRIGDRRAIKEYLQLCGDLATNLRVKEERNFEDIPEEMVDAEIERLSKELGLEEEDVKPRTEDGKKAITSKASRTQESD